MRAVQHHQHRQHHRRSRQPHKRGALPIEDGDNQDGNDVVGNRKRAEEHAQARRHARAQKRQDSQREGDVGCRGHAPPHKRFRIARVEQQVNAHRHKHAADSRTHRQDGLADIGKLAYRHLVLDFQTHQQEEHCHKHIVDDVR